MKVQLVTPLIGIIVTALLSVWKTPGIREGVFSWIGKLPRVIQWLAPLTISMLATAGEGFLNGKSGEDLFYFAMGNGAEAGAWAIATWHVAKRIYEFVKGSPATQAFILLGALAAGGTQVGCNRATIDTQIDKALLFEDQVIVQVNYLDSVFAQLVVNPAMPAEKQAEFRAKFAEGKAILMQAMQAKDSALRAAKAANAEVVNLPELVNGIVDAVQQIIQIVAMVGASPVFVQEQQTRAMGLSRGI